MITQESFDNSYVWVKESTRCLIRAIILKQNYENDFNGQIEALQHCFELACKSWYFLVGKRYPKNHDPAKGIDDVVKKLYSHYPLLNNDLFQNFLAWMKDNSSYLSKLHETSIYGDEKNNIPASKLFSRNEVGDYSTKVSAFWSFTYYQLFLIGSYFEYLSEEQKTEFNEFLLFMNAINTSGLGSLTEEERKRLFPFL